MVGVAKTGSGKTLGFLLPAGPWPGYGTTHSGYGTTPVGWGGGNRYVEGDLLTFGYLMLNDSLGYPYYRLINIL